MNFSFFFHYPEGEVWYIDNPNFDFEKTSFYEISVTVSNGKKVSQAKSIYVNIKDVNEPPTLDNLPAMINLKEDFVKAGTIFKVSSHRHLCNNWDTVVQRRINRIY